MKTYRAHCALFYTVNDDSESECTDASTHYVNLKSEVEAELAAKDAEIDRLISLLYRWMLQESTGEPDTDLYQHSWDAVPDGHQIKIPAQLEPGAQ